MIVRVRQTAFRVALAVAALLVISAVTTRTSMAHGIASHVSPIVAAESEATGSELTIAQVADDLLTAFDCQHAFGCCTHGACCGTAGSLLDRVFVADLAIVGATEYLKFERSPLAGSAGGPETPPPRRMI